MRTSLLLLPLLLSALASPSLSYTYPLTMPLCGRSLHWVFKSTSAVARVSSAHSHPSPCAPSASPPAVSNLKKTLEILEKTIGMHVLRHEEFNSGCEASCNGDYARPWSKTMVGFGQEDNHFVLELTFNYGIKRYEAGNDFRYDAHTVVLDTRHSCAQVRPCCRQHGRQR